MGLYLWLGLDSRKKIVWQEFIKLKDDRTIEWQNSKRTAGNWRYNYRDGTGFFMLEFSAAYWKPKKRHFLQQVRQEEEYELIPVADAPGVYNDLHAWSRGSVNHYHAASYEKSVIMKKVTVSY